jgi:hypothetical protein
MKQIGYPDWTRSDVIRLYRETYRPLRYEPYTGYADAPCSGKYVNVQEPGFRRSADETWPPPAGEVNIFVFGGSTTFGHGLADWETIPARMRVALTNALGYNVNMYNFGRSSYQSTQERILFQELLHNTRPTHAIWFDGLNDFVFQNEPMGADRARQALEPRRLIDIDWKRITHLRAWELIRDMTAMDTQRVYSNHAGRVVSDYADNLTMCTAICREYGIKSLFIWQPIPTHKYDQTHHAFRGQYTGNRDFPRTGYEYMDTIIARGNLPSNFVSLASIQTDLPFPLYIDAYHYNAAFADVIGRCIAAYVVDGLRERK